MAIHGAFRIHGDPQFSSKATYTPLIDPFRSIYSIEIPWVFGIQWIQHFRKTPPGGEIMIVGGFQGSMNKMSATWLEHSPWLHKTWLVYPVYPVCCSTCNIGRLTSLFVSLKISLVGWHPSLCCCHPDVHRSRCQPMDCFCPHVVEITIFPSLLLEGGAISCDCCFKSQTVTRFEGLHR